MDITNLFQVFLLSQSLTEKEEKSYFVNQTLNENIFVTLLLSELKYLRART